MAQYKGFKKSLKMYKEAMKYLPAGVSSNARVWRSGICPPGLPCSLYVSRAKGAYLWDVDGNRYIDYRLGYGPVILGHDYEAVSKSVHSAEHLGTAYAAGHELEIRVAKKLCSIIPCAEMARFSSTGTEATMHALRIARAATKKDRIIKFEGHFHGLHDYLLWSTEPPFGLRKRGHNQIPHKQSLGIPDAIKNMVIVERWNNFEAIEKTVKENKDNTAAIITEPIMGNAAAIMPKEGYLKHLRELCDRHDMLLIFDEVKTGFRAALGGAQELFRVKPDIATFAKALGNGFPISAIVGKKEYMELVGPGMVAHGGTYSSNPVSLAAADTTIRELIKRRVHDHINSAGKRLMNGLDEALEDRSIPHLINGIPAMFQIAFTKKEEIREWRDLEHCELTLYPLLQTELMKRGVLTDADIEEPLFLSFSHGKREIEKTVAAYGDCCIAAYDEIRKKLATLR
ncbi:MAG: aspartate aminotransferase family protein [Candidatus Aenigmarchaeota archaeon]|nr:aspartate aminotransferase family protein [Candidatus Aenigmarchaeota archaeon]